MSIGAHLHDTRGLAVANGLAALAAGANRIDAAVGGLGGCPFAPGASGNVAIEDVAHALEAMGVDTGCSVSGLIDAAVARMWCRWPASSQPCRCCGTPVRGVGQASPNEANSADTVTSMTATDESICR